MPINNRLTQLLNTAQENLLTVYFTAGYPQVNDTLTILQTLAEVGADIIEIGMPFSDPIADGTTIQESNQVALEQGMTIQKLFEQLADFRATVKTPVLLMGYLNPVMQFGIEKFCQKAAQIGIDGLILPDLPMIEYQTKYRKVFEEYNLSHVFLVTPETSKERIQTIDQETEGFIYAVSSSSTTGKTGEFSPEQVAYFERLKALQLKNPFLIGFGIADHATYQQACTHSRGAIIGSAFIRAVAEQGDLKENISAFIKKIKMQ